MPYFFLQKIQRTCSRIAKTGHNGIVLAKRTKTRTAEAGSIGHKSYRDVRFPYCFCDRLHHLFRSGSGSLAPVDWKVPHSRHCSRTRKGRNLGESRFRIQPPATAPLWKGQAPLAQKGKKLFRLLPFFCPPGRQQYFPPHQYSVYIVGIFYVYGPGHFN